MAIRLLKKLIEYASEFSRPKRPVYELVIDVKCGRSDGFPWIEAISQVGRISDKATGNTEIISDVPKMLDAEHLLYQRCKNREVFEKMRRIITK